MTSDDAKTYQVHPYQVHPSRGGPGTTWDELGEVQTDDPDLLLWPAARSSPTTEGEVLGPLLEAVNVG